MFKTITRTQLVGVWFAAVVVVILSAVVMGVNPDVSTTAVLLGLAVVPPGIIFGLWRGGPPATVGEILYATNKGTEGR